MRAFDYDKDSVRVWETSKHGSASLLTRGCLGENIWINQPPRWAFPLSPSSANPEQVKWVHACGQGKKRTLFVEST
jgi:hypothetical protein